MEPGAPEILSFAVSPAAVEPGESMAYSWEITGATTCRLDVNGAPDHTLERSSGGLEHSFSEAGRFTATLNVTGNGRSASATASTVTVTEAVSEPIPELTWQPSTPQPFGVAEAQGVVVGTKLHVFGGFDSQKRSSTPHTHSQGARLQSGRRHLGGHRRPAARPAVRCSAQCRWPGDRKRALVVDAGSSGASVRAEPVLQSLISER